MVAGRASRWKAGGAPPEIGDAVPNTVSTFEWALQASEGRPDRTASAFRGVRWLYGVVLGMLYQAAQRLIDAKSRGRAPNHADEALILLCNRLFNESFAGYVVLSRGLLGAGEHHLRAALETANLATLFVSEPEHAERWLGGKEYSPRDVRKLLDAPDELRDRYARLSKMTHANYAATRASVFSVHPGVEALSYGGLEAPRAMASSAMAFMWVALTFLRSFYHRYADQLDELSLLWPPEVAPGPGANDLNWERFLDVLEKTARNIQDEIESLPEDEVVPKWVKEILAEHARGPQGEKPQP